MSGQQQRQPITREKLEQVVGAAMKVITEACDSPVDVLTVLMHASSTALWFVVSNMKKEDANKYVVSYCVNITKLIDASIKANE